LKQMDKRKSILITNTRDDSIAGELKSGRRLQIRPSGSKGDLTQAAKGGGQQADKAKKSK